MGVWGEGAEKVVDLERALLRLDLATAEKLVSEGVRLSIRGRDGADRLLHAICDSEEGAARDLLRTLKAGQLKGKAVRQRLGALHEEDFEKSGQAWELALKAGIPEPKFEGRWRSEGLFKWRAAAALRAEAKRQGGLPERAAFALAGVATAGADLKENRGLDLLRECLPSWGREPISQSQWVRVMAMWAGARGGAMRVLEELAGAGKRIPKATARESLKIDGGFVVTALGFLGDPERLLPLLGRLGADFEWAGPKEGQSGLMELLRRGGPAEAAEAYLAAAEAAREGARRRILEKRDKNGAGIAHWAGRGQSASLLSWAESQGADLLERDAAGNGVGHWIARGTDPQKGAAAALRELEDRGYAFGERNRDGESELDLGVKRQSGAALRELFRIMPGKGVEPGPGGRTPIEVCRRRSAEIRAAAEGALMDAAAGQATAPKRAKAGL